MSAYGAYIIVRYDPTAEQEFLLTESTITLGREPINDVVLYDPEASRRHAQILFLEGRYVIEDLGSTNGTFLNGRRINVPAPLRDGDLIEMGDTVQVSFYQSSGLGAPFSADPKKEPAVIQTVVQTDQDSAPSYETPSIPYSDPRESPRPLPDYRQFTPPPPPIPEGMMSAEPVTGSPESLPASYESADKRRRYIIGCGCLALLAVAACATTFLLLDQFASETLYCGPLESLFDALADLLGRTLSC